MRKFIIIFAVLVFIALNSVLGLKCWRCFSELPNSDWCKDNFNASQLPPEQIRWHLAECVYDGPDGPQTIPPGVKVVCNKAVFEVNGEKVYNRYCGFERQDGEACSINPTQRGPDKIKAVDCTSCSESDGCNGAEMNPQKSFWSRIFGR